MLQVKEPGIRRIGSKASSSFPVLRNRLARRCNTESDLLMKARIAVGTCIQAMQKWVDGVKQLATIAQSSSLWTGRWVVKL